MIGTPTFAVAVAPSKVVDRLAELEHAAVVRWLAARDASRVPGYWWRDEVYDDIVESRKNLEKVAREVREG